MNPNDRERRRELRRSVGQIQQTVRSLLLESDPIGGVPQDEYDCMIGPLYAFLSKRATAEARDLRRQHPNRYGQNLCAGRLLVVNPLRSWPIRAMRRKAGQAPQSALSQVSACFRQREQDSAPCCSTSRGRRFKSCQPDRGK